MPVHALPPEGWFFGEIRVPFSELASGTNFFILEVEAVPEEDPALVARKATAARWPSPAFS